MAFTPRPAAGFVQRRVEDEKRLAAVALTVNHGHGPGTQDAFDQVVGFQCGRDVREHLDRHALLLFLGRRFNRLPVQAHHIADRAVIVLRCRRRRIIPWHGRVIEARNQPRSGIVGGDIGRVGFRRQIIHAHQAHGCADVVQDRGDGIDGRRTGRVIIRP